MVKITLNQVAFEWKKVWEGKCKPGYSEYRWKRLNVEALSKIGDYDINNISAPLVLSILRDMEKRDISTPVRKIHAHLSMIFDYAIVCGYILNNPVRGLKLALTPHKSTPHPAILDPIKIGKLMKSIYEYKYTQARHQTQMLALTFVRANELAGMRWDEIDREENMWYIPGERMKMKKPHDVPLSKQALVVLKEQREYLEEKGIESEYVFPSRWDCNKHSNGNVVRVVLRRIGIEKEEMVAHGFRAMAATTLSELGFGSDIIEKQLAHADGSIKSVYQRSKLLDERRKMMQFWGDWLDQRLCWAMLGRPDNI